MVADSQGFHRVDFYKSLVDEWPAAKARACADTDGTEQRTLPELLDVEVRTLPANLPPYALPFPTSTSIPPFLPSLPHLACASLSNRR